MCNQIKKFRKERGLTLVALAKLAGSSHATIQRLESGHIQLTRKWADRLAPLLGVHPIELMFTTDEVKPVRSVSGNVAEPVAISFEPTPVKGRIGSGIPQPTLYLPEDQWRYIPTPVDERYPGIERYCLDVDEGKANGEFVAGDIVICVDMDEIGAELEDNAIYVVDQKDANGGIVSQLCQLKIELDGRAFLWDRADDAGRKAPLYLPDAGSMTKSDSNGNEDYGVRAGGAPTLRARVIGEYKIR